MKSIFPVLISLVLGASLWLWQVESLAYAENLVVFYASALTIAGLLVLSVAPAKKKGVEQPRWVRGLTRLSNIVTVIVLAANAYFFIAGLFAFVLLVFYARDEARREESAA